MPPKNNLEFWRTPKSNNVWYEKDNSFEEYFGKDSIKFDQFPRSEWHIQQKVLHAHYSLMVVKGDKRKWLESMYLFTVAANFACYQKTYFKDENEKKLLDVYSSLRTMIWKQFKALAVEISDSLSNERKEVLENTINMNLKSSDLMSTSTEDLEEYRTILFNIWYFWMLWFIKDYFEYKGIVTKDEATISSLVDTQNIAFVNFIARNGWKKKYDSEVFKTSKIPMVYVDLISAVNPAKSNGFTEDEETEEDFVPLVSFFLTGGFKKKNCSAYSPVYKSLLNEWNNGAIKLIDALPTDSENAKLTKYIVEMAQTYLYKTHLFYSGLRTKTLDYDSIDEANKVLIAAYKDILKIYKNIEEMVGKDNQVHTEILKSLRVEMEDMFRLFVDKAIWIEQAEIGKCAIARYQGNFPEKTVCIPKFYAESLYWIAYLVGDEDTKKKIVDKKGLLSKFQETPKYEMGVVSVFQDPKTVEDIVNGLQKKIYELKKNVKGAKEAFETLQYVTNIYQNTDERLENIKKRNKPTIETYKNMEAVVYGKKKDKSDKKEPPKGTNEPPKKGKKPTDDTVKEPSKSPMDEEIEEEEEEKEEEDESDEPTDSYPKVMVPGHDVETRKKQLEKFVKKLYTEGMNLNDLKSEIEEVVKDEKPVWMKLPKQIESSEQYLLSYCTYLLLCMFVDFHITGHMKLGFLNTVNSGDALKFANFVTDVTRYLVPAKAYKDVFQSFKDGPTKDEVENEPTNVSPKPPKKVTFDDDFAPLLSQGLDIINKIGEVGKKSGPSVPDKEDDDDDADGLMGDLTKRLKNNKGDELPVPGKGKEDEPVKPPKNATPVVVSTRPTVRTKPIVMAPTTTLKIEDARKNIIMTKSEIQTTLATVVNEPVQIVDHKVEEESKFAMYQGGKDTRIWTWEFEYSTGIIEYYLIFAQDDVSFYKSTASSLLKPSIHTDLISRMSKIPVARTKPKALVPWKELKEFFKNTRNIAKSLYNVIEDMFKTEEMGYCLDYIENSPVLFFFKHPEKIESPPRIFYVDWDLATFPIGKENVQKDVYFVGVIGNLKEDLYERLFGRSKKKKKKRVTPDVVPPPEKEKDKSKPKPVLRGEPILNLGTLKKNVDWNIGNSVQLPQQIFDVNEVKLGNVDVNAQNIKLSQVNQMLNQQRNILEQGQEISN